MSPTVARGTSLQPRHGCRHSAVVVHLSKIAHSACVTGLSGAIPEGPGNSPANPEPSLDVPEFVHRYRFHVRPLRYQSTAWAGSFDAIAFLVTVGQIKCRARFSLGAL
jgi:hypothetical protein